MDLSTWGAAQWGAFGQVGALLVAAVAGFLVWQQVRHAREAREDQTRPYVIVDFEFRGMMVLVNVKNIGSTAARDVAIAFDPPLRSPSDENPDLFSMFDQPIPMIAPGRSMSARLGVGPDFFVERDDVVPLRYVATVSYLSTKGRKHSDPDSILDLRPFKHTAVSRDDIHQIQQHLKKISQTLGQCISAGSLNVRTSTKADWDAQWDE